MRRTFVPPSGDPSCKLAGCGEQPGYHEVRARPPKPFVGPAGQGLDDCLIMTKIPRSSIYLTNVIKDLDAPLKHYIDIDTRGKWNIHPEGYEYIKELGNEIKNLNLNCMVAFGNIALLALCNRVGITKWRGSVLESTLIPGLKVVPTFHPATFIPPKFNFLNKPLICEDLLRAKYEATFKDIHRTARNVTVHPSFDYSIKALEHCFELGLRGQIIGIDIEVINREVDCISFGWSPTESISIPFRDNRGDYFDVEQELAIMRMVAKIIQDKKIAKVGASFIFDTQFLLHKYGINPRGSLHCTQIAQKISFPDFPAGLDAVTTMHTDIPYYKADGKQWMKMGGGTWEQWWNYNGLDAIVPVEAIPKQIEVLRKQNNIETYDRQRKLIKPLIYMSERGIRIDVEGMMKYSEEQQISLDRLAEELNTEVGYEINYNSPQQLMNYFYKELGFKPYKKKNAQGQYADTSDVDALKRLARQGVKAARIMLDIRSLAKRISTYLDIGKVDKDGRYRSSYKPVGAGTGRLSSGETIFGTGGNQQNWPHDLLRFFLFDAGYIGYSLDLSQIENRIVAYVGGVLSQIEAIEQGINLHTLTASIIFKKPYDQISDIDGSSFLGDGRQSEYYWGKKGNHGINYDESYKKFALINEMPETEAKEILEDIHRGYPQIRGGYHITIQNMLKSSRTVTNLFGRTRLFLGPVFPSYPNVPQTACNETYRVGYAQLPQSTCADKVNEQGLEYIYYNQDLFRPIELLAQIHDSIVFQIPLSAPWEDHARMLLLIKKSLETSLYWHGTEIETPADLSIGKNMCKEEMIKIKSKDIPTNVDVLADKLREVYSGLTKRSTSECSESSILATPY
uniref:Putative DNA polymerase n=2 Tax=viral metagenome TaxID=1070528 RepID=A0A6M3KU66_9ZZZZ